MPYLHLLVSPDCLYQNVPRCGDALGMLGGLDPFYPRYLLHFNGITLEPLGVTNPFRILPVLDLDRGTKKSWIEESQRWHNNGSLEVRSCRENPGKNR